MDGHKSKGLLMAWALIGASFIFVLVTTIDAEARRGRSPKSIQRSKRFNPKAYKTKLAVALAKKAYKANGHIPKNFRVLSVNKTTVDYFYIANRIGFVCTNSHDSLVDLSERPICTNLGELTGKTDLHRGKIHRFRRNSNGSYDIILGQHALEQFKCKVFPGNQVVQSCAPWKKIKVVSQ